MRESIVHFYSKGLRLSGIWRTPDAAQEVMPAIVQGPGWLGLKDATLYLRYHEALTQAGFGVLIFDYRGFGDSEGDPTTDFSIEGQVHDLVNAVTYLTTRDDVDSDSIGVFGSGGTGGANAIMLAGVDDRVRAAVAQVPVADGRDWLRRMRTEYEWLAFLEELASDRMARVQSGVGKLVHPREGIMVPTPERRQAKVKKDVDSRVPTEVPLAVADEILQYRPIDVAAKLHTPLMVIAVENDATTPTDHAVQLFEAARGPKELVYQRHTTHYAAYEQYGDIVAPRIVVWLKQHVQTGDLVIETADGEARSITHLAANRQNL